MLLRTIVIMSIVIKAIKAEKFGLIAVGSPHDLDTHSLSGVSSSGASGALLVRSTTV
jgi:hypothetical protein